MVLEKTLESPLDCKEIQPVHPKGDQSWVFTGRTDSESESEVAQSCPTLCDLWTVADQSPLSMGFSRQEYWSGLPFPSPGDLPDPGIELVSLASPALAGGFFTTDFNLLLISPNNI